MKTRWEELEVRLHRVEWWGGGGGGGGGRGGLLYGAEVEVRHVHRVEMGEAGGETTRS